MLATAWVAVAAAWAAVAYAAAPAGLARSFAVRRVEVRSVRLESAAVLLWIASLFLGFDRPVGPVEHFRPADVTTAIVALVALRHLRRLVVPVTAVLLAAMAWWALILVSVATDRKTALVGVIQLVEFAVALVAVLVLLEVSTRGERSAYLAAFMGIACLESLLAVVQSVTNTGDVNIPSRGIGTLGLFLGYILIPPLGYATWRAVGRTSENRALWIAVTAIVGAGVVASQTRQSWVAALVVVTVVLFARSRLVAVAVAAAVIVGAVGASQAAKAAGVEVGPLSRVDSIVQLARGHTFEEGNWTLTSARVGYWRASVKTIRKDPLGIGAKNFRLYLPALAQKELPKRLAFAAAVEGPHNQYLFTAVELGIPGLLLLLALAGVTLAKVLTLRPPYRVLGVALWLGVALQAAFGDVLFGPAGMETIGLVAVLEWALRHPEL